MTKKFIGHLIALVVLFAILVGAIIALWHSCITQPRAVPGPFYDTPPCDNGVRYAYIEVPTLDGVIFDGKSV